MTKLHPLCSQRRHLLHHGHQHLLLEAQTTYPFPEPEGEFVLIIGEQCNQDITQVYEIAVLTRGDHVTSDDNTSNGQHVDFTPCFVNGHKDAFQAREDKGFLTLQ